MSEILDLFSAIQAIVKEARQKAYSAVNFAMVEAYWQIGRQIVEKEQDGKDRADYGAKLIESLAAKLTVDFGKGFSVTNLENFRKFYLIFSGPVIPYAVRRELSWTHYRLIMRVENAANQEISHKGHGAHKEKKRVRAFL